jgi:hypothetical protein
VGEAVHELGEVGARDARARGHILDERRIATRIREAAEGQDRVACCLGEGEHPSLPIPDPSGFDIEDETVNNEVKSFVTIITIN